MPFVLYGDLCPVDFIHILSHCNYKLQCVSLIDQVKKEGNDTKCRIFSFTTNINLTLQHLNVLNPI